MLRQSMPERRATEKEMPMKTLRNTLRVLLPMLLLAIGVLFLASCGECDHTYGEWTVKDAPTCTAIGYDVRRCTKCGAEEVRETEKLAHSYTEETVLSDGRNLKTPATCTAAAVYYKICHCGAYPGADDPQAAVFSDGPYAAHDFGDWRAEPGTTCEAGGKKLRTCKNCSYVETQSLAPTEHAYTDWEVEFAASCEALGREKRSCTICGKTETRSIPATGHAYEAEPVSVIVQPGEDTFGTRARKCRNPGCDAYVESSCLPVPPTRNGFHFYPLDNETCEVYHVGASSSPVMTIPADDGRGRKVIGLAKEGVSVEGAVSLIIPKTVKYIGDGALTGYANLKYVLYAGGIVEWAEVENVSATIGALETRGLLKVYFYSSTKPKNNPGAYWHYDTNGAPKIYTEGTGDEPWTKPIK